MIELVLVVVILGVVGTIAVPRMSRGAARADETSLIQDLRILRGSIELYRAEHGGKPPADASSLPAQLTMFTDRDGATSTIRTSRFCFGPYLRTIPPLPIGRKMNPTAVRDCGVPGSGTEGWFYDPESGNILANTNATKVDASGIAYNSY